MYKNKNYVIKIKKYRNITIISKIRKKLINRRIQFMYNWEM